jgi:hypothetical protein
MMELSQTRRWITSLVLAFVAVAAPASAVTIDVRITADNAYRLGVGPGFIPSSPNVENCLSASEIFPCGSGPEQYTVTANSNDYLYIVAYDKDSGTQGVLGQFQFGTNAAIYTGDPAWQVCASGTNFDCNSGGPLVQQIVNDINVCNTGDPLMTSKAWVDTNGTAIGKLAVGEVNGPPPPPVPGDVFQQACTTIQSPSQGINVQARWMWYNWDPANASIKPFDTNSADDEYLIFRLPVREVPGVCTTIEVQAQYAVKFVCYRAFENPLALVRGFYGTAINVHNPSLPPSANEKVKPARLAKKVAVALPGEKVGRVSPYRLEALRPDEAFEIDCAEILRIAGVSPPQFLTGFVVIDSDQGLDVTAIYTGRSWPGEVSTIDVENVPERKMEGKLTVCP